MMASGLWVASGVKVVIPAPLGLGLTLEPVEAR
jgi:hypothetical protein